MNLMKVFSTDVSAAGVAPMAERLAGADLAAQGWWLDALDMLVENSSDRGAAAAAHIKAQLGDADTCAGFRVYYLGLKGPYFVNLERYSRWLAAILRSSGCRNIP